MLLLFQLVATFSVAAIFLSVIYMTLRTITNPGRQRKIDSNNNAAEPYILRRKEYETYRALKYGAGIKSAAMSRGALILIHLDLVKVVNQKDFVHFSDRHPPAYHSDPTMNKMLSFATGEDWKRLKVILTQAFSSSRIRRVHQGLDEASLKLVHYLRAQMANNQRSELEVVAPANKYLLEVIGSSVFGLEETGIFSLERGPFEVYTKEVQKAMIRHRRARLVPGLLPVANLFNLIRPNPKAVQFFRTTIQSSIDRRRSSGVKGDDMLQFLLDATTEGPDSSRKSANRLSEDMILPQALMFFFAGTEGPATLLIYGLYEMAMNQDVQDKLFAEIASIMESDTLDHEALGKLPYLDMFVCEVLRMYSSSITARRCSSRYRVPGTNIVLEPGSTVHTPIYGIHHDEEFYPEPFKFNPLNCSKVARAQRPAEAFMPFGIGPRSCIAQKFGLVQGKSALCQLIYNFRVEPCWKTETPPKGSLESLYLPINGLWLKFIDRQRIH